MFKRLRILFAGMAVLAVSANATMVEATTSIASHLPMDNTSLTGTNDFVTKSWMNLDSTVLGTAKYGKGRSVNDNFLISTPGLSTSNQVTVNMWLDKATILDNLKILSMNKDWGVAVKDDTIGFTTGNEDFYGTPISNLTPGYNMFSFVFDKNADQFGTGNKIYINGVDKPLYKSGFNEHDTSKHSFKNSYSIGPYGSSSVFNQTLSAGQYQSCAVMKNGSVKCWGQGVYGNVGPEYAAAYLKPVTVGGVENAIGVSTEWLTSCALLDSGKVKCWGYSAHGQIGKVISKEAKPNLIPGVDQAVQISSSKYSHCALLSTGDVKCWGYGANYQVYDGVALATNNPVAKTINGIKNATSVAGGHYNGCATISDGTVKCWGYLDYGMNGQGVTSGYANVSNPLTVKNITNAEKVSSAHYTKCALLTTGQVKCWGWNNYGQAGDGAWGTYVNTPRLVPGVSNAKDISVGQFHSCALLEDDSSICWGRNDYDQLGRHGGIAAKRTPAPTIIEKAKTIAAGGYHTCFGLEDGNVKCAGYSGHGERGVGSNQVNSYVAVDTTSWAVPKKSYPNVKDISTGAYHTCITDATTGGSRCFGYGYWGQLGVGTGSTYSTFNPTGYATPNVGAGLIGLSKSDHTYSQCWIQGDGDLYCSGYSANGQIRSTTTVPYPKLIDTNVKSVSTGYYHGCWVKNDGTVWCIGYNGQGRLGINSTITQSAVPKKALVSTAALEVHVGREHSCALLNTGRVQCWGRGDRLQVNGQTSVYSNLSPVTVPNLSGVVGLTTGSYHTCALLNTGNVKCWGMNSYGQATGRGDDKITNSTMVEIPNLSGVTAIDGGSYHTCALLNTGKVNCWGYGNFGEQGDGSLGLSHSVSEVSDISDIKKISAGGNHTCAIDGSNQSYCWGRNNYGQLGQTPGEAFEYPNAANINGEWATPEEDVIDNLRECFFAQPGTVSSSGGSFTVNSSLCAIPDENTTPTLWEENLTLIASETSSTAFSGWTNNALVYQNSKPVHGMFSYGSIQKTFNVPGHILKDVRIEFDFYAIDSWDGAAEYGYVDINGDRKWSDYKAGSPGCSGWSNFNAGQGNDPWNGQGLHRCYKHVVVYAKTDEAGNVVVKAGSTINQSILDESWAFGGLKIYKVDYTAVTPPAGTAEVLDASSALATDTPTPASCSEIKSRDASAVSGEYDIEVSGMPAKVYCDMDTDGGGWTRIVADKTPIANIETIFNGLFGDGTGKIIKYEIPTVVTAYYSRKSSYSGNPYKDIVSTWKKTQNALHSDFELYSSWSDLENATNAWGFCNFSDDDTTELTSLGFPRDCGKDGLIGGRWLITDSNPYLGSSELFTSYDRPYSLYIKGLGASTDTSVGTSPAEILSIETAPALVAAKPRTCLDVQALVPNAVSGIYTLYPDGSTSMNAYCNMTYNGGGWTMVWSNLRATAGVPTKYMTIGTASSSVSNIYGTVTKNGLYYAGIPNGFEAFMGFNWWNKVMLDDQGEFMYLWKSHQDTNGVHQGFYSDIMPFKSSDKYTLRLSNYKQIYGGTVSGVWSYHTNKPFTTYNYVNSSNTGCGNFYSYTPFWYGACWNGSINGGGENYGSGYYDGAYWVGSDKRWATTAGIGAGAGYYYIRPKGLSPEVKTYLESVKDLTKAEVKFKCGNVTKFARAEDGQTLSVSCADGSPVEWIRGTLYKGDKYLFYKDMFLKGTNMDEIAVWKKALTASEIAELYGSGNNLKNTAVAGVSCNIAKALGSTTSGTYFIKPSDTAPIDLTMCQMDIQKGGWTLVAKVSNKDGVFWSSSQANWTGSNTIGNVLRDLDYKNQIWSELDARDILIVENNNPSRYLFSRSCLGDRTLSEFFTEAFTVSPFNRVGIHHYKSCGVFKSFNPTWAYSGMDSLVFAKNDGSTSYGVISTYPAAYAEGDYGVGSIELDAGWGTALPRSDFGYGTSTASSLWPQTLYIYVREPLAMACPPTHPVDNGDGTCSSPQYQCPEGYTIDNGDGTCSRVEMVCPAGYVEYAADPTLCIGSTVDYTTSSTYMYCPNNGDPNSGKTIDTDFTHTCAKDIAAIVDPAEPTVSKTVLMETQPGFNAVVSVAKMRDLTRDWTEPLRMVAFDGDKEISSYFNSAKLTFPYEKEVADTRPFWYYYCESPAVPTSDYKYRSDVINYFSDYPATDVNGQHPAACKTDKYMVCE